MWRLSHVLLKAFGTGLGLVCLYAAVYLYRDERERVQNHLEDWWQKIRNKQATALSSHVALMQTVGDLTTRLYDRTFGNSYFSVRAIVVSVCFSMVSFLFTFALFYIRASDVPSRSDILPDVIDQLQIERADVQKHTEEERRRERYGCKRLHAVASHCI
jgi:hypothetical protein